MRHGMCYAKGIGDETVPDCRGPVSLFDQFFTHSMMISTSLFPPFARAGLPAYTPVSQHITWQLLPSPSSDACDDSGNASANSSTWTEVDCAVVGIRYHKEGQALGDLESRRLGLRPEPHNSHHRNAVQVSTAPGMHSRCSLIDSHAPTQHLVLISAACCSL